MVVDLEMTVELESQLELVESNIEVLSNQGGNTYVQGDGIQIIDDKISLDWESIQSIPINKFPDIFNQDTTLSAQEVEDIIKGSDIIRDLDSSHIKDGSIQSDDIKDESITGQKLKLGNESIPFSAIRWTQSELQSLGVNIEGSTINATELNAYIDERIQNTGYLTNETYPKLSTTGGGLEISNDQISLPKTTAGFTLVYDDSGKWVTKA